MKRRTRFIAGIFALIAMTGALAEGVMASVCPPGMEMGTGAMSADAGVRHDGTGMPDGMPERGERQELPDDGTRCPFAPLAAQGCLVIASIPASGIAIAESPGEAGDRSGFDDEQQDLLLHTALFHPPRA